MAQIRHKTSVGSVILGLLNGLKHTPQTIGPLLGLAPEELEKIILGEAELTREIETALVSVTGINQGDFYPLEVQHLFPVIDDTNDGVVIFRNMDTIKSRRTLTRGPQKTPYYIYADTAMSNLSSFRPEWIKELYVHDGENADDLPDWAFNKGHFEHQVNYFIGPVNFYWKNKEGQRHVCQMNTGDTNYIVPFVPHTFTTRKEGEGLILAVTYGGAVSNPEFRSNLSALGLEEFLKNARERLPVLSLEAIKEIQDGVVILRHFDGGDSKGLNVFNLTNSQPHTKVIELTLQTYGSMSYNTLSACWGYVIGNSNILFGWGRGRGHECLLKPGDSFLIKPEIPHIFIGQGQRGGRGKLLVVDINPQSSDPYMELAMIEKFAGEVGLRRVHTETTRWY